MTKTLSHFWKFKKHKSSRPNQYTILCRFPGDIRADHIIVHIGEHATVHWHMCRSTPESFAVEGPLKWSGCISGLYTIQIKHVGTLPTITVSKENCFVKLLCKGSGNQQACNDQFFTNSIVHISALQSYVSCVWSKWFHKPFPTGCDL